MCYFITIATPLSLSEVRSMLPAGVTAHPAPASETALFRRAFPAAQTVATLLAGACSCDLVRPRDPDRRVDERHLRERYFRANLSREHIIRELERHRRGHEGRRDVGVPGPEALAAFVLEHARNAGPTLYGLRFGPGGELPDLEREPAVRRSVAEVRAAPAGWLAEGIPTLVVR